MKEDPHFYLTNNGTDTSSCGREVFSACRTFPWLLGVFYNESYINSTDLPILNLMLGTSLFIGPDILVRYITFYHKTVIVFLIFEFLKINLLCELFKLGIHGL